MKRKTLFLATILIALGFVLSYSSFAQKEKAVLKIKEAKIKTTAQCELCKERIEKAVKKLNGIESCDLQVDSKVLTVKYDSEATDIDKIRKAVNKAGYGADDTKADAKAYRKLPKCCQQGGHENDADKNKKK